MTTIEAIPTIYRNIRYRSRLEARWAMFFDLLGWQAHYEPFDLNGWIPDFILHGRERIAVEVKPVRGMDDPLFVKTATKIRASKWDSECLIVSYFLPRSEVSDALSVGWLLDWGHFGGPYREHGEWAHAVFQHHSGSRQNCVAGFSHEYNSYADRITGYYDGSSGGADEKLIQFLWTQAINNAQWSR